MDSRCTVLIACGSNPDLAQRLECAGIGRNFEQRCSRDRHEPLESLAVNTASRLSRLDELALWIDDFPLALSGFTAV
jgi:hypothetical protein